LIIYFPIFKISLNEYVIEWIQIIDCVLFEMRLCGKAIFNLFFFSFSFFFFLLLYVSPSILEVIPFFQITLDQWTIISPTEAAQNKHAQ